MLITKSDLKKALQQQEKNIILGIIKLLKAHVINKLFKLGKDVGVLKKDVRVLKKDMKEVKHDIEKMDRRLEKSIERADRHGQVLDNHEKRITSLEISNPQI